MNIKMHQSLHLGSVSILLCTKYDPHLSSEAQDVYKCVHCQSSPYSNPCFWQIIYKDQSISANQKGQKKT